MSYCRHSKCSKPMILPLRKAHHFLCAKSEFYHNWHHHPHHHKVHWAVLAVYSLTIVSTILSTILGGQSAYASSSSWNFGSDGDYTLSDSNAIQIAGNSTSLKPYQYSADGNTSALYHLEADGTDATGANTLTAGGTPTYGAGKLNNAATLNGSSDFYSKDDSASLSTTSAQTIEAFTKFPSAFSANSLNQRQTIADKGSYQLYFDQQTGKIKYEIDTEDNKTFMQVGGDMVNGSWDMNGKSFVYTMETIGNDLYAGVTGTSPGEAEVWRWSEATSLWTQVGGSGLYSSWSGEQEEVGAMETDGTYLYVGLGNTQGDAEVWKCTTPGGTPIWEKLGGDGVKSSWAGAALNEGVYSMAIYKGNLVAGLGKSAGDADLWLYNGSIWSQIAGDSIGSGWLTSYEYVYSLVADSTYLYAGLGLTAGEAEVWRYTDSPSATWTKIGGDNAGIPPNAAGSNWNAADYESVLSMVIGDGALYAGLGASAGDSEIWRASSPGDAAPVWVKIAGDGVGAAPNNLSWDSGTATHEGVYSLGYDNGAHALYAGLGLSYNTDGEVWRCTNPGIAAAATASWTQIGGDDKGGWTTNIGYVHSFAFANSKVYAGIANNYSGGNWAEVWSLSDTTWTQIGGNSINAGWSEANTLQIDTLNVHDNKLYAGLSNTSGWLFVWEYNGTSWRKIGGSSLNGSWTGASQTYDYITSMASYKGKLYVGMAGSTDDGDVWQWNGSTWTKVGGDGDNNGWTDAYNNTAVFSMTLYDGKLCASTAAANASGVWCFDETNWERLTGNLNDAIRSIIVWNNKLYVATSGGAGEGDVFEWTGSSWSQIGGDGTGWAATTNVSSLAVYQNQLHAAATVSGIVEYYSYNGSAWTKIGGGGLNGSWSDSIEITNSAVVYNGELYIGLGNTPSGDAQVWKWDGASWSMVGGNGVNGLDNSLESVQSLTVYNGKLFAGTGVTAETDAKVFSYGNNYTLSSNTAYTDAEHALDTNWHHFAATYNGTTMKLFIDGVEDSSRNVSGLILDSPAPLYIGSSIGSRQDGGLAGFFGGSLDEIRISNIARVSFNTKTYITTPQSVRPNAAILTSQVKSFDSFSVDTTGSSGTIIYRLSDNGGTSWKYYNSGWVSSGSTSDANTAAVINTNIGTFPVGPDGILWQAILLSTGEQATILNSVTIEYTSDTVDPVNPTATATAKSQETDGTDLTTNTFYAHPNPYFTWDAATDTGGSGVAGYYVYFGTSASGNPKTARGIATELNGTGIHYQTDRDFKVGTDSSAIASGNTYYLRVLAKDNAQNPIDNGSPQTIFIYKYDNDLPISGGSITATPESSQAQNRFAFSWPVYTDASSSVASYYYRLHKSSGGYFPADQSWTSTAETSITLTDKAEIGTNTLELKAVDIAGNESAVATKNIAYALPIPTDLTVTPASAEATNTFTLSWSTYAGGNDSIDKYYYRLHKPSDTYWPVDESWEQTADREVVYTDKAEIGVNTFEIKTVDKAGNTSATTTKNFTYSLPAPTGLAATPAGLSAVKDFTFFWTATTNPEGYYYRVKKANGVYEPADSWNRTTDISVHIENLAETGTNTFELKVRDNAGNYSETKTTNFYFNNSAPSPPQNLHLTTNNGAENIFAFSWDAPATFQGDAALLNYFYSINTEPRANTVSPLGHTTSLPEGPHATWQGVNTIYVIAQDAAGNIEYGENFWEKLEFTASTVAPGKPTSLNIADSSIRLAKDYRLVLTWAAPASGTSVEKYLVKRSTDGTTFVTAGEVATKGYVDTDLDSATTYYYKVYSEGTAGSLSAEPLASDIVSKQPTGKYPTPPEISEVESSSATTSVIVRWKTDRSSDSFIEFGPSQNYGQSIGVRDQTTSHEVKISGLIAGQTYHYHVQSLDPSDLKDYADSQGYSTDYTFATAPPPALKDVEITDVTTNSAILSFETTTSVSTLVEYGINGLTERITDDSNSATTKHAMRITNLLDGASYQLQITITDNNGDKYTSTGYSIKTLAKPTISKLTFQPLQEAQTAYKVNWETNVPTTSVVEYTSDKGDRKETASGQYLTAHELLIRGLQDQSRYIFQVSSVDQFGNTVSSEETSINTPLDSRPPRITSLTTEVKSSGFGNTQKAQLVVSWETDEPATSQIEYSQGISGSEYNFKTKEDAVFSTNHVVIVSELEPSKIYHLRAVSKDKGNNAGYSEDTTTITGKIQSSVVDIILNSLQRSLGWIFGAFES